MVGDYMPKPPAVVPFPSIEMLSSLSKWFPLNYLLGKERERRGGDELASTSPSLLSSPRGEEQAFHFPTRHGVNYTRETGEMKRELFCSSSQKIIIHLHPYQESFSVNLAALF